MKPNPAKKNRTRQATAAVLALALGAAVYLNWSFARAAPQDLTVGAIADGTAQEVSAVIDPLTDDTAVETAAAVDTTDTQAPTGKNYGEAQMVSVSKDSGAEFFESARLARTKARDEALDTLKKSLKDAKLSDAEKKKLTEDLAAQVSSITLETKLETLIKSKGFADCVVDLEGKKANVTVMTENDALTAAEVTRIRDALLSQCEGLAARHSQPLPQTASTDQNAETIISGYVQRSGVKVEHRQADGAYYQPSTDRVVLPLLAQFAESAAYYSTAFHELVHSTGHSSRLDRLTALARFGSDDYSKEELVAEIGAAALVNHTGLETSASLRNNAAYIQNWLDVLKGDKRFIVSASSKAEKAVALILGT